MPAAERPIAFPAAAAISVPPPARRTAATPASASASSPAAPSRRPGDYRIDEGVSASPQGVLVAALPQGVASAARTQEVKVQRCSVTRHCRLETAQESVGETADIGDATHQGFRRFSAAIVQAFCNEKLSLKLA